MTRIWLHLKASTTNSRALSLSLSLSPSVASLFSFIHSTHWTSSTREHTRAHTDIVRHVFASLYPRPKAIVQLGNVVAVRDSFVGRGIPTKMVFAKRC